jgi:hypothetical protein
MKLRQRGSLRSKVQGQPTVQCDVLLDRKILRMSHLNTIVSLRVTREQEGIVTITKGKDTLVLVLVLAVKG